MAGLASGLDEQSPFEHHVFAHGEGMLLEYRPHLVDELIVQLGAARHVGGALYAEADFGKGDGADKQKVERFGGDEADDLLVRFWPP
jgi:hypothetical protein